MPPEDRPVQQRHMRLPGVSSARGPGVQGRVTITLVHHNSDLERHLYQLQGLRAAWSDISGFGVFPKISVGASQSELSYTQSTRKSQGYLGCHETSRECKIMFNLFSGLWVLFFTNLGLSALFQKFSVFSFSECESKEPCLMKNTWFSKLQLHGNNQKLSGWGMRNTAICLPHHFPISTYEYSFISSLQ